MPKCSHKSGFSLVELIIVIGITLALSILAVGYNREAGRQLVLVTYQAKLVNLISRAKSFSVYTFVEDTGLPLKICGYGVFLDKATGEAFIFRDLAVLNCSFSDKKFGFGDKKLTGNLNVLKIDTLTTRFAPDTTFSEIIFIPPDPAIIINKDITVTEAVINIELSNGARKVGVRINNAGSISTQ